MIENLFINILGISITSSAAVAAILLISKLAENRFRKKWRYWIWIFLAVYLIIPIKINLPSAPIKMDVPPHEMIITQSPEIVDEPEKVPEFGGQMIQSEHQEKPAAPDLSTDEEPLSTEPKTFVFPVVFVGAVLWISGAIIVCGWNVAMYIRFLSRSKPWNREVKDEFVLNLFECIKKEMNVPEKVKIYENRLIKSPMMVGFGKPRVLLPSEALLPEEYEFVLRHELTHYKRGDLWYKMLLMLAASVHWFNPFIGFMCRNAENDIEITCDEAVVKAMEGDRRQEYCATILNIMRRGQNSPLLLSTSFYGGKKFLKSRFAAVLNPKTHRGVVLFVLAAIVIVISGTMVACNSETETIPEEPAVENEIPAKEGLSESDILERAQEIVHSAFTEISYQESGYYSTLISEEVKEYIETLSEGKKKYYDEIKMDMKEESYSVASEVLYSTKLGDKTEILYIVEEKYEWDDPNDAGGYVRKTDKYHSKLTYDSVTGLFDGFIIYKVNWMDDDSYYVTMGSENDPRPVVEGPAKNGTFPFISSSQWDRWVTYDGKADTVMPTEPISSVLECGAYLAELSKNYPEINDWEIVYEDCYYELTYCYDPYTYSFREIYMPERFAVLKTEQSDEFDRLFVSTHEEYTAVSSYRDGYVPMKEFQSSTFKAFEADVQVGDMSGAEHYQTQYVVSRGLWFPEEQKMLYFDWNSEEVFVVKGVSEPLCITSFGHFGKWTYLVDGNTLVSLPEERKDDLYLYVSENGGGHKEEIAIYYYYSDTKTVKKIEDSDAKTDYSYPQVMFLDSETMLIDNSRSLNFYDVSAGADATVCVAKIDGEGTARTYNFIREDKTIGGRYLWVYTSSESNEFRMCTFDKEGNVLSDFGLGLSADGTIGSANYHNGLVYFSYHVYYDGRMISTENYAVDARPDHEHILQANAW